MSPPVQFHATSTKWTSMGCTNGAPSTAGDPKKSAPTWTIIRTERRGKRGEGEVMFPMSLKLCGESQYCQYSIPATINTDNYFWLFREKQMRKLQYLKHFDNNNNRTCLSFALSRAGSLSELRLKELNCEAYRIPFFNGKTTYFQSSMYSNNLLVHQEH